MIVFREFTFDAAHFLPNVPANHKCRNIHGHTYRLMVFLEGEIDPKYGWVMDFAQLKDTVVSVVSITDHCLLNDIKGLENPTCELLAVWLWKKLKPMLPLLKKIELKETSTAGVVYSGK